MQSRPFINGAGFGVNVLMIMSQHSDLTVKICIKPIQSDVHVSGSIKREGAWELETVNNVIRAMQSFPNATFLGELIKSGVNEEAPVNMFPQTSGPTSGCTPWWWPP